MCKLINVMFVWNNFNWYYWIPHIIIRIRRRWKKEKKEKKEVKENKKHGGVYNLRLHLIQRIQT